MEKIEIKITVTQEGKYDKIKNIFPQDVPIARLAQILGESKNILAKAFVNHCKDKNILPDKIEEISTTLTLRQITNE